MMLNYTTIYAKENSIGWIYSLPCLSMTMWMKQTMINADHPIGNTFIFQTATPFTK